MSFNDWGPEILEVSNTWSAETHWRSIMSYSCRLKPDCQQGTGGRKAGRAVDGWATDSDCYNVGTVHCGSVAECSTRSWHRNWLGLEQVLLVFVVCGQVHSFIHLFIDSVSTTWIDLHKKRFSYYYAWPKVHRTIFRVSSDASADIRTWALYISVLRLRFLCVISLEQAPPTRRWNGHQPFQAHIPVPLGKAGFSSQPHTESNWAIWGKYSCLRHLCD